MQAGKFVYVKLPQEYMEEGEAALSSPEATSFVRDFREDDEVQAEGDAGWAALLAQRVPHVARPPPLPRRAHPHEARRDLRRLPHQIRAARRAAGGRGRAEGEGAGRGGGEPPRKGPGGGEGKGAGIAGGPQDLGLSLIHI